MGFAISIGDVGFAVGAFLGFAVGKGIVRVAVGVQVLRPALLGIANGTLVVGIAVIGLAEVIAMGP